MLKTLQLHLQKVVNSKAFYLLGNKMQFSGSGSYSDAVEALNGLVSNASYIKNAAIYQHCDENKLPEVQKFLNRSGISLDQLDKLKIIHITGTNGKGTTCAYSESILRKHGYKTGFFSSPHILEVRERIRINGIPISKGEFAETFWKVYNCLAKEQSHPHDMPQYFRFLTIMAFHIFLTRNVDVAILEVGIGGEYDCTNIVRNTLVAGITSLDMDHEPLLGNTLELIAWQKGGIFKPGARAFTIPQPESVLKVLQERAAEKNCALEVISDNYKAENNNNFRIPTRVYSANKSLALAITKAFIEKDKKVKFDPKLAEEAIESTYWPGRYEILQKNNLTIYMDGAHTVDSITTTSKWFKDSTMGASGHKCLIFNMTGPRNPEKILKILMQCDFDFVFFVPNIGRENDNSGNSDPETINKQLLSCNRNKDIWCSLKDNSSEKASNVTVCPSIAKALSCLNNTLPYSILITGSIHLVGAAFSILDPDLNGTLKD